MTYNTYADAQLIKVYDTEGLNNSIPTFEIKEVGFGAAPVSLTYVSLRHVGDDHKAAITKITGNNIKLLRSSDCQVVYIKAAAYQRYVISNILSAEKIQAVKVTDVDESTLVQM